MSGVWWVTRKASAGQPLPRAPQLVQEALCTAPATRKAARKLCVLCLHATRKAAAGQRAARTGGSVYCACHTKGSRGPAAATRVAAPPRGSLYCTCHTKGSRGLLQEALCTASATRKAAAGHIRKVVSRHKLRNHRVMSSSQPERQSHKSICSLCKKNMLFLRFWGL